MATSGHFLLLEIGENVRIIQRSYFIRSVKNLASKDAGYQSYTVAVYGLERSVGCWSMTLST